MAGNGQKESVAETKGAALLIRLSDKTSTSMEKLMDILKLLPVPQH